MKSYKFRTDNDKIVMIRAADLSTATVDAAFLLFEIGWRYTRLEFIGETNKL